MQQYPVQYRSQSDVYRPAMPSGGFQTPKPPPPSTPLLDSIVDEMSRNQKLLDQIIRGQASVSDYARVGRAVLPRALRMHPAVRAAGIAADLISALARLRDPRVTKEPVEIAEAAAQMGFGPGSCQGQNYVPCGGGSAYAPGTLVVNPDGNYECQYGPVSVQVGPLPGTCTTQAGGAVIHDVEQRPVPLPMVIVTPFTPPWKQPVAQPKSDPLPAPFRLRSLRPQIEDMSERSYRDFRDDWADGAYRFRKNAQGVWELIPLKEEDSHRRQKPGKGVRERKIQVRSAVWWAANVFTESSDFIECLWKSLPSEFRRPIVGRQSRGGGYGDTVYPPLSGSQWRALARKVGRAEAIRRTGAVYDKKYDLLRQAGKISNDVDPKWAAYWTARPVHQTIPTMLKEMWDNPDRLDAQKAGQCAFDQQILDHAIGHANHVISSSGKLPHHQVGPAL